VRYSPETDLSYTYSWGNKPAADLPGNGTTREEWKVGTAMLGLSRHRRLSLTGETLVNPLPTVSAFSRIYVVARSCFIPRAPKKRKRRWRTVPDTRTGTILFYRPFASHVYDSFLRRQFFLWAVKRVTLDLLHQTSRKDWIDKNVAFIFYNYSLKKIPHLEKKFRMRKKISWNKNHRILWCYVNNKYKINNMRSLHTSKN